MKTSRFLMATVFAAAIFAPVAGFAEDKTMSQQTAPRAERLAFLHGLFGGEKAGQSPLAALTRANDWLNAPPLMAEALRGKVVLVNFWTYTCINWLRQLPYVRGLSLIHI